MISLKTIAWTAIGCFALALLATNTSHAQLNAAAYQRRLSSLQTQPPRVSPYLNLISRTATDANGVPNNDGVYHTLVRPQVQATQELSHHQLEINQLRSQMSSIQANFTSPVTTAGSTGHASRFMSFSHYYPQYAPQHRR